MNTQQSLPLKDVEIKSTWSATTYTHIYTYNQISDIHKYNDNMHKKVNGSKMRQVQACKVPRSAMLDPLPAGPQVQPFRTFRYLSYLRVWFLVEFSSSFLMMKPLILVDFAGHIPTVPPVPRVPVADPSSMEDALLAAFSCLRTMAMTTSSSLKPGPQSKAARMVKVGHHGPVVMAELDACKK